MPTASSIQRLVAEVPMDVFRGIARISEGDSKILVIEFGDFVKLETPGGVAYARAMPLRPHDEREQQEKIQIDAVTRNLLRIQISEMVTVSRLAKRPPLATAVEMQPLDGTPQNGNFELDDEWLASWIEERAVWKDAVIFVPIHGEPRRFRITSVKPESSEVSIGSVRTKVVLPSGEQMNATTGQLFAFNLVIEFKRKVYDYDALWKALEKRGFSEKEYSVGFSSMVTPDLIPPEELEAAAVRSERIPRGRTHMPNIKRGRIQVLANEQEFGYTLHIGHGYDHAPWENPNELLRDMEEGIPLINQTLEQDLGINFKDDVNQIRFNSTYKVSGKRGPMFVMKNAKTFPFTGSSEMDHLRGYRTLEGWIMLRPAVSIFPGEISRTLTHKGLIEIKVGPMGDRAYTMTFDYGLSDVMEFAQYFRGDAQKSEAIIQGLESETHSD